MIHAAFQSGDLTYGPGRKAVDTEALICRHREMVRRIAWHVHASVSAKIEFDDLVQIGLIALIESARGFEDRGAPFAAYARTRVRGAMLDQLRREARMSRAGMVNRRRLAAARANLEAEYGRKVSSAEMAAALTMSIEDYHLMVESAQSAEQESIDDVYNDDQPWFADLAERADSRIEREQQVAALSAAIARLPEREGLVLQLYFVEEMNLEEIGAVLNVGAARICQMKKTALAKVRALLEN